MMSVDAPHACQQLGAKACSTNAAATALRVGPALRPALGARHLEELGWVQLDAESLHPRASVSTWDTEENARADRLAGTDLVSRVQALGVQLDAPEFFEVTSS